MANDLLAVRRSLLRETTPALCDTLERIAPWYANIILTKLRGYRTYWRPGHASVGIDFLFRTRMNTGAAVVFHP